MEILEGIEVIESKIKVKKIVFPFVICLNQECDLERDFETKDQSLISNNNLLHLAIAPAFIFEQYLNGTHWGGIFNQSRAQKRKDTAVQKIIDNEIPRYHYLKFPESDMPELIIDFKHFFSISKTEMYAQLDKRLCSLDDLFKENVNLRFSNYISRIGLPTL